jgi:hypothetical protein
MVLRLSLVLSLVTAQNNAQELSFSDNPIYYFDGSKAVDVELAPRFAKSLYPFGDDTFEDSLFDNERQHEITPANSKENIISLRTRLYFSNNAPIHSDDKVAKLLVARQQEFKVARRNSL